MACVQGDHEAGEGGEGERGAPGETAFSRAGGGQEIPEAERQVHREGTKGEIFVDCNSSPRFKQALSASLSGCETISRFDDVHVNKLTCRTIYLLR